eukprot:6451823-Amphidinium_carterae.1
MISEGRTDLSYFMQTFSLATTFAFTYHYNTIGSTACAILNDVASRSVCTCGRAKCVQQPIRAWPSQLARN